MGRKFPAGVEAIIIVYARFSSLATTSTSLHFDGVWSHVGPDLASLSRDLPRCLGRVCPAMLCPAMTRCVRGGLAPASTTSLEVRRIPSAHRVYCSHLRQYFFIPIQAPVARFVCINQRRYHPVDPVVKSCPAIASEAWDTHILSLFHPHSLSSPPPSHLLRCSKSPLISDLTLLPKPGIPSSPRC
jgi:hypothetical protein